MKHLRRQRCRGRNPQEQGFTYIALLIAIVLMGVGLAATGEVWSTVQKQEKERQLLFVGGEFRRAIASYSAQSADATARYPLRLEDLLKDPRVPGVRRHLRRLYIDPVTGGAKWGLLKARNGEIYGVYSLSDDATLKRAGFDPEDSIFEGKTKYSEWTFSPVQIVAPRGGESARATGAGRQVQQSQ
jgi:type II secretory pathway pseudopilin PulG